MAQYDIAALVNSKQTGQAVRPPRTHIAANDCTNCQLLKASDMPGMLGQLAALLAYIGVYVLHSLQATASSLQ